MAHNAQSINGKSPNAAGNVTIALGDLSDVTISGTPSQGDMLQRGASGWTVAANPGVAAQFIFTGAGSSVAYPVSTFAVNDDLYFHAGGLINNITGATINYLSGQSGVWIESITLPIGRYSIVAQTSYEFSASGYLAHVLTANGTYVSNIAAVGSNTSVYGPAPTQMQAIIDASAETTVRCKIHALSNVSTTQPNSYPSKCSTYLIRKVL
jgi:hypothetical protein